MTSKEKFIYVTYIATTPEAVWAALIDPDMMSQYWKSPLTDDAAHVNVSDWKTGSRWEHRRADETHSVDLVGTVVEFNPPRRLVLTWARPSDAEEESRHSHVTFEIEPHGDELICLTVTHEDLDSRMFMGVSDGWPKILSNLKTLLETGRALSHSAQPQSATASGEKT